MLAVLVSTSCVLGSLLPYKYEVKELYNVYQCKSMWEHWVWTRLSLFLWYFSCSNTWRRHWRDADCSQTVEWCKFCKFVFYQPSTKFYETAILCLVTQWDTCPSAYGGCVWLSQRSSAIKLGQVVLNLPCNNHTQNREHYQSSRLASLFFLGGGAVGERIIIFAGVLTKFSWHSDYKF